MMDEENKSEQLDISATPDASHCIVSLEATCNDDTATASCTVGNAPLVTGPGAKAAKARQPKQLPAEHTAKAVDTQYDYAAQ